MNNKIQKQVKYILDNYGNKIKTERQVVLLYWKIFDKVEMNKENISTPDFLNKATNMSDITNAIFLIKNYRR